MTAKTSSPHIISRRIQLRHKHIPFNHRKVCCASTRIKICCACEEAGGIHIARGVHRYRIAIVITGATELLSPHIISRRIQFRHKHIGISSRRQVCCTDAWIKIYCAREVAGGIHIARGVHRHRIAIVIPGVTKTLSPHIISRRIQLRHKHIVRTG